VQVQAQVTGIALEKYNAQIKLEITFTKAYDHEPTTQETEAWGNQIFAGYGMPPGGGGEGKDAGGTVVYTSPDISYNPRAACGPNESLAPYLHDSFTSSGFITGPEQFTYNGQQMWRLSVVVTTTRNYQLKKFPHA
jgi:hypothetical protein